MSASSSFGGQLDPPDGPLVLTLIAGIALALMGAFITAGGGFVLGYGVALMVHAGAALRFKYRRHHH